uniref:Ste11alpha protein n=1 Tax=Ganoderma boninense TaxID=34458 RepID=A0A5K1K6T9_9APHY|nr:Ste11alpha protein [Ganoderma boninense]
MDDTNTASSMHEIDGQTFSDKIPGSPPSAADRAKFSKPNLTERNMSEHAFAIELAKTLKSVLRAAESQGLRVLHSPPHNVRGCSDQMSDSFNRVGIYLDAEIARRATTLTATDVDGAAKKLAQEEAENGDFGRHSWHWMAVLGVVKSFDNPACAFCMGRASSVNPSGSLSEADGSYSEASNDDAERVQLPFLPSARLKSMDDVDGSSDTSSYDDDRTKESAISELAEFMYNLSTCQHRTFVYGFYVQWRWARLLYFDRTGVLVSEPFDWTEASSPLHDFVWKFAHMTPEQRGYDPTAQMASYDEIAEVSTAARSESLPKALLSYIQKAFLWNDKPADHSGKDRLACGLDEAPIYRLTVTSAPPSPDDMFPDSAPCPPTTNGSSEHAFLVGRPHFAADSLVGRCTRGYVAWDISEKRFCFLKDSWRCLLPGRRRPEHLIYERLHSHGVRYIATLACGGDVESKRPTPRVHYRIVTKEIGISLTEFANFGELNNVFMLALAAHYMAWNLAGILHRDVSVGNILIDPITRDAFLIDWDLSRLRSELDNGPVEPNRTGTWQFRSALSLAFPRKPYRLSDDIESFVHTYRWMVLRFHETEVQNLRMFVENEYEEHAKSGIPGVRVGGETKLSSFSSPSSRFKVAGNPRLQGFLQELARECFTHYQMVDLDRMDTLYGLPAYRTQEPVQLSSVPAAAPANVLKAVFGDGILDVEPAHVPAPIPGLPDPKLSGTVAQPARDPCDVDGFLSKHQGLVKLLYKWSGNTAPRQVDQFVLQFNDDYPDAVSSVRSRHISSFSQSQTHDG